MAPLNVLVKHAGNTHNVQLNTDLPPNAFKDAIYAVTGVPADRMKVMIKGGVLKEDTDWKKVGPKEGQTFTVIGTAGELPKPPTEKIKFLEDMDESELADALTLPVGLVNLGNTCYMNASVQALRAIPELQTALAATASIPALPASLRDTFASMGRTTTGVTPSSLLAALRQVNPQFAEIARGKGGPFGMAGYAQQDAEECYGQIIQSLRPVPGVSPNGEDAQKGFVEQYMMGTIRRQMKCDEAADEPPTLQTEAVLKIECNITITTNFLMNGIMNALDTKITKQSPSLNREAQYTMSSRVERLPKYLSVHMVRFEWRADIRKKTKIMRRVKFPMELDALELCTEEYKKELLPVSRALKEISQKRAERRKIRKRMAAAGKAPEGAGKEKAEESQVAAAVPADAPAAAVADDDAMQTDPPAEGSSSGRVLAAGEIGDEKEEREKEMKELAAVLPSGLQVGASAHGLYDLVAIVTHKGAAADSGHYMAFVRKSVFHGGGKEGYGGIGEDESEDWYKFDDDKVSVFPAEKIATLEGGGEDSSAYILLYRSKDV